jgi:ubiquinone/menaquinone biosynthesis C-methylase UbiE
MTHLPSLVRERIRRARGTRRAAAPASAGRPHAIQFVDDREPTVVDEYWTGHTVNSKAFPTPSASSEYLEWRFAEYPLFREFSGLWGDHAGETVLDYGCGPGDDLTGLALHSGAARLVGLDVSATALRLAAARLGLHAVDPERVVLRQVRDGVPEIPLEDGSVDYVNCNGVLQHTSSPERVLVELRRVLRPGGRAFVMVYNSDSVWLHLYVAYAKMLHDPAYMDLALSEAFRRLTDGPDCPISRHYTEAGMRELCEAAGFDARYVGGYLSRHELDQIDAHWATAIADERLDPLHRGFLRGLRFDRAGFPMAGGFHAGIGGVYHLRPRSG